MSDEQKVENYDEKLDVIIKGLTDVQKANDKLHDERKNDVVLIEEIKKRSDDIALKAEQMQKEQIKKTAEFSENLEKIQNEMIRIQSEKTISIPEYDNNYAKYLRKGIPVPQEEIEKACEELARKNLYGATEKEIEIFKKDLVAGSDPDGGIFLTTDRSSRISTRMFETSPLRNLATVETTTSDVWEIVLDDDEPDAGWVGEVTARPVTGTAQVGLIKIPIHEIYASPKATQKILDDAGFDIAGWHERKVTSKFSRMENTAFVVGDGASKPKGFLDYAAWAAAGVYERNKVEQRLSTGTAGTLDEADDFINLQNDLIEDYQAGATWGMQRKTFAGVMTLKEATTGAYLINPRIIAEGAALVLLGNPIVFMADMPTVAAASLSVVYANFKEFYTIVDRFGVRVLRDPFTSKPYVIYYTTKRVGGAVTNYEAGKIMKTKS